MNQHSPPRRYLVAALLLLAVQALASALLAPGFARTAVTDISGALLMLAALLAFATNGYASSGRMRWLWALQAAGWALWLADQAVWIMFDVVWRQKMPAMQFADALLFLAGAPMFAGVLLRPHREPSERSARLGAADFLLLLLWWLFLYISFVVCWQYIVPNEDAYNRNFDLLATAENMLLTCILAVFWWQTSGRWKKFYGLFSGAVACNAVAFYLINRAIEQNVYFTGDWHDLFYSASFAVYPAVALAGEGLSPTQKAESGDGSWLANWAMIAVLSLPVIACWALLDPRLPRLAAHFRVLVALATMFLMVLLLFIQHQRLNRELRHTNVVLHEASLTDPLTGLRNRRYFSATIDADVSQALRAHADGHDLHIRDLVFYLIDADDFKEVNDRYGHDVGDRVLVEMTRRVSSSIRDSDVLVRWGGEEFLLISRHTDRREAELLAKRVLAAVADMPFNVDEEGGTIYRNCSVGWAAFPWFPDNPRAISYREVLTLADRGLHQAKVSGKNRAVGMLPPTGKVIPISVEGLHAARMQVDVLAVSGPSRQP
ncbi:putative Diguanylate cyclase [Candidatus Sulfotelmatobacter kueseliae]|uniref:diguanylate cyclase n=1 Tax=Candidatus Sulfotelmatobacter kueseliae TaxID=2042962 RepID=A0A2U3K269_9BACT|nr:putative Diguanylate cyclase [Candidatus Sulfotelmatobacter kueseliae]